MLFNSILQDGSLVEVVEELKLLGIVITSYLKWKRNTRNMIRKAYKRMWVVKRLKLLGASKKQLILTNVQQVRSALEIAVPVWQPGLTVSEILDIERVQKSICHNILVIEYIDYQEALAVLGLETLEMRRLMLCRSFASKTSKNE